MLSSEVPGAVVRAFSQRGSSFSRIHDEPARRYSHRLYDSLLGRGERVAAPSPEEVLASLLAPFDLEDLVFVYMQVERGYLVLPGSRRTDTAVYEYVLPHPSTREQAMVQVKTGSSAVDLEQLKKAAGGDHKAYAFSTTGSYTGSGSGVELLSSKNPSRLHERTSGGSPSEADAPPLLCASTLRYAQDLFVCLIGPRFSMIAPNPCSYHRLVSAGIIRLSFTPAVLR